MLGEFPIHYDVQCAMLSLYLQPENIKTVSKQLWCSICFICIVTNGGVNQASLHAKEVHKKTGGAVQGTNQLLIERET